MRVRRSSNGAAYESRDSTPLSRKSQTARTERDEEAAEQESDDASSLRCGAHEQRDPERDEHDRKDDHRDSVGGHATSVATVSTRQGACLRM